MRWRRILSISLSRRRNRAPPMTMEPKSWCFQKPAAVNALTKAYNEQIRPLLDAVNFLRRLEVMQEEIKLRPIVFVSILSFGKSSVIESLVGIRLHGGKGIHTGVPLIVRLQDDPSLPTPRLHLEYNGKRIESSEADITEAIEIAASEISGPGKCISDTPVTVVVRNNGSPDLTLVDLPGITVVPADGQPRNIGEQVSGIIMKYIEPAESIIVNVIPQGFSLTMNKSLSLSKQVDRTGERTLAVIIKTDKSPVGPLEKFTADDADIGLGCVWVRNRIGCESFEEARASEAELFESHHLHSRIDKSMAGIPVLAQRLMKIQAQSIAKCLPADIMKKINEKLNLDASELDGMMPPNHHLASIPDAKKAFAQIISRIKESPKKLLIREEFEMLSKRYATDMLAYTPSKLGCGDFLMEEIAILEEARGIGLPTYSLQKTAFTTLLQRKLKDISSVPHDFVSKVWSYVEEVALQVLGEAAGNYPHLQVAIQITAQNLIDQMRKKSQEFVREYIDMEKTTDYTCSPHYTKTWTELIDTSHQQEFKAAVCDHSMPTKMAIGLVGEVDVSHLREKYCDDEELTKQAFHLRILLISYWKCVVLRVVDAVALHVRYAVNNLVDHELGSEIVKEVVQRSGNLIEKIMQDKTSEKEERLRKRIQMLHESKDVVGKMIINLISYMINLEPILGMPGRDSCLLERRFKCLKDSRTFWRR
ncbi:Dynamin-related protein 4C [Platanthera guangdongensis]|uniref:Dynamin-related protein 4C n=1 Tax=Platanthera guangdongensis TaxID=2320717 RepID=A0ABR2N5P8_9ASPA